MIMKMTKEQFIESMHEAKEGEERNTNTPHTIRLGSEVKEAVEKGSGTKIARMAEPIHTDKPGKREDRKLGRLQAKVPESWKERIKASIELMAAEGAGKLGEAETLIHEAEELIEHIETLKEMIK